MNRGKRASFSGLRGRGQVASRGSRALVGQSASGRPRCQSTAIGGGRGIDNGEFGVILETDILEVSNIRKYTVGIVDLGGMEGGRLGRFRPRQLGWGVGARADGGHDLM